MAGENAFTVEGQIVDVLPNGTYRVKLSNGHCLLGFLTGRVRALTCLATGERVNVELSPYDLSRGRIIRESKTK